MKLFGFDIPTWKRQTSSDKFDAVNITSWEANRGDFSNPANMQAFIQRYSEYVGICADMNATNVASVRYRLYRRKRSKNGGRSRAVGREARKYLTDAGAGRGPGIKAAAYAQDANDIEEVADHPALKIISDPNPKDQSFNYWHVQQLRKEMCGNAFHHVVDERGRGTGRVWLFDMFPQHVNIDPDKQGGVRYFYGRDQGDRRMFPADEVLHDIFAKSLFTPIWGAGPLEKVIASADIYTAAKTSEAALFQNGARPDTVIKVHENTTPTEMRRYEQDLLNKFRGSDRRGRFLLIRGDMAVTPIGYPPKDMEYKEGVRAMTLAVANAYGIPFTFLDLPTANLASSLAGNPQYARGTLHPRVCRHAEWLTETILPLLGEEPGELWFAADNVIPEDMAFNVDRRTRFVSGGVLTINEARTEEGLEPIDGGDVLRVNGVPLDALGAPAVVGAGDTEASPLVATDPAPDANKPTGEIAAAAPSFNGAQVSSAKEVLVAVTDGELAPRAAELMLIGFFGIDPAVAAEMIAEQVKQKEESDAKTEKDKADAANAAEAARVDADASRPEPDPAGGDDAGKAHRQHECKHGRAVSQKALFADEVKGIDPNDPTERGVMAEVVQYQRDRLNALFAAMNSKPMGYRRAAVPIRRKAMSETVTELLEAWGLTDYEELAKNFEARVKPVLQSEFVRTAEVAAATIRAKEPSAENFAIDNPNAAGFARQWEKQLLDGLDGFNRTTSEMVGEQIAQSIEAGEGIAGMERRIREAFESNTPSGTPMTEYRASVIARTESARSRGRGEIAGWAATGVVKGREWLLSANPCQFCEAADRTHKGKPVPLDQPFYKLGDTVVGTDGGVMSVDFTPVWTPTEIHPQCVCSELPVIG